MTKIDLNKQLAWQCRRGMLELDVILLPFLEHYFDGLTPDLQYSFEELLKQEDPDLFTWIMGYEKCNKEELIEVLQIIRFKMQVA